MPGTEAPTAAAPLVRGGLEPATVTLEQVQGLRSKHGIYMADSGRANLVGIADRDLDRFCHAVVEAMDG